jgi:hypothetical protein
MSKKCLAVAYGMSIKGWKSINIHEEVYAKLEKRAEKEHRSITNMAEVIILEATK